MKIKFTDKQIEFMKTLDLEVNFKGNLDTDSLLEIDEVVNEYLIDHCDDNNEQTKMCEDIMNLLG